MAGDTDVVVGVDCDVALIESAVMERIEQKSISPCKAFRFWVTDRPGLDMAGDEKGSDSETGYATCSLIIREQGVAKVLLINSLSDSCGAFLAFW